MEIITTLTPIIIAYLLGGIPFGLLIARLFGVPDIRREGSGNIGATNVWRVVGPKAAVWVYIMDISKGVAAVIIARLFTPEVISKDVLLVICALVAVTGSLFPVYLRFRGGKGVNTSLGVMITLLPLETLICLVVFLVAVVISRFISLGSLLAAVGLPIVVIIEKFFLDKNIADIYLYLTVLLALLVILSHRQNISRLLTGKENQFNFPTRTNRVGSHV